MDRTVGKFSRRISGEISLPGDKSISHRAVLLGSLARGRTEIDGFLMGEDCLSTVACVRRLGIDVEMPAPGKLTVLGKGLFGWQEPGEILDAGNSGTTIRLMLGALAGQPFYAVMTGDASLRNRPMARVVAPLRQMGARIDGRSDAAKAPLSVRGGNLKPITFSSPVSSAQVKSAILLAGLFTGGETTVIEPARSRDHTERMLKSFGAQVASEGCRSGVKGLPELHGQKISIPGDISSAAFFLVAAAVVPRSELTLRNVGVNPSRKGIIDILKKMGAEIVLEHERLEAGEPVADISVRSGSLHGVTIEGEDIPRLIDEIPVLAVAAAFAEGTTVIKDARELRVKETDRISTVVSQLAAMNVEIEAREDGMVIRGGRRVQGAIVDSFSDHRIAMALAVAGICGEGETVIRNAECVNISFPGFFELLQALEA